MRYTISTAKGSATGTYDEVLAWQAEMQGAYATVDAATLDDGETAPDKAEDLMERLQDALDAA